MGIALVSSYQQLQDWHSRQKARTEKLLGSASSAGMTDFSDAFAGIASNFYSASANVTAQAAVSRIQSNIQLTYAKGNVPLDFGANAARTSGNAILSQLGYVGFGTNTARATNYSAPVNAATGKAYVQTSGASLNNLNSLNLFA